MGAQPPKMEAQWRETEKSVIFNIFGEPTVIQLCSSLQKKKKEFFLGQGLIVLHRNRAS